MGAFKIRTPRDGWRGYKFPVIKLSYNPAFPRNADGISGVISDKMPKLSLPWNHLPSSMCRFPRHLQGWLITSQWCLSLPGCADQQAQHVQWSLQDHPTLPLCFRHVSLIFPWGCLMKNNEQISHIPQTGTHHDKTHTRLMLWFKGIIQPCLTRNHLEQDHCFGGAQGSHGTNEHAKI